MFKTFETLPQLFAAFPTEQSAIDHLTAIRWAGGEFCAVNGCADAKIFHFSDGKTHKCSVCRARFSIKVGTIFQDSKLPLRTWFAAIWMITNHPKGIASTTLATDLGITQKSAWFVLHRLRWAARTDSFNAPLMPTQATVGVWGDWPPIRDWGRVVTLLAPFSPVVGVGFAMCSGAFLDQNSGLRTRLR